MNEQRQTVPVEGITRVTLETTGADLTVRWVEQLEKITIVGADLPIDRAGDELFIRADLRGIREQDSDVDIRITDFESPGKLVEDILKQTGLLSGHGRNRQGVPVHVQLPSGLRNTTLEVYEGDLTLDNPRQTVGCKLKKGSFKSTGGTAELDLSSGSGDVHISRLEGSVRAACGSGDITLIDLKAIANVKAGSGEVSLTRVTGDAIKLAAGSGDLDVIDCRADAYSSDCGSGDVLINGGYLERISIRTGSGDVRCTAGFGPYGQSITTGSGSVSLGVPRDLPARIEAFTSSGDIDTELPLVSVGQRGPRSRRSNRQVGSVGSGEPRAELSVRTSSGDIRIHWMQGASSTALPMPSPPDPPETPQEPPAPPEPPTPDRSGARASGGDGEQAPNDEWRQILESLANGEITVEEADALLDTLESRNVNR